MRALVSVSFGFGCLTATAPAVAADPVEQCISAHEEAQRAEQAQHLRAARELYLKCSAQSCPALVRSACHKLSLELEQRVPKLRVVVRGGDSQVMVQVDERDWQPATAKPIPVDPGQHVVRIRRSTGETDERTIQVQAGGIQTVAFAAPKPSPEPSAPVRNTSTQDSPPAEGADVPVGAYVAGGAAVLGLVGFAIFGQAGRSKQSKLDSCKADCTDRELYDDMKADYLRADISLAIGVLSGALATYLILDAPKRSEAAAAKSEMWLSARAMPDGAALRLGGAF